MAVLALEVGAVRLTRVGYADVEVPPETVGLTADAVESVAWAEPVWAGAGGVGAAAAAWVIESDGARIVVDPALAADGILRNQNDAAAHQEAFAALLADAGFARDTITHAVATHIDGIGMFAWRGADRTWTPFFPNAPILLSQRELDAIDAQRHPDPDSWPILGELRAIGAVRATGDREQLTPDVVIEHTGAHTAGHQVVRIDSEGERALIVGHLAASPLQLATGVCQRLHDEHEAAWATLTALRDEGALLIGPLWPTPGAGRWNGTALIPAG
jgi:glyoxylase-like metal-dependent hydrolase (beta-lactamase superfamily II)